MKKYAKIENNITKKVSVGLGDDLDFYKSIGMTEMDVEQSFDGSWYILGYAPQKNQKQQKEEKIIKLKELLRSKDYIGIKIATGVATKEDYAEEIKQCELWREEIRKLEGEI